VGKRPLGGAIKKHSSLIHSDDDRCSLARLASNLLLPVADLQVGRSASTLCAVAEHARLTEVIMCAIQIKSTLLFAAVFAIAALGIPRWASAQTPTEDPTTAASTEMSSSLSLCENAWDFNAPFGVPGFGSIRPNDVEASLALIQIGGSPTVDGKKHLATPSF